MKLWFDSANGEIVTEKQLRKEYAESWLPEMIQENGPVYVVEHAQDFSFDTWVEECLCSYNGTLSHIWNADKFKIEEIEEVKPNEENDG